MNKRGKKQDMAKAPRGENDKGTYRSVYSAIWDDPEFQAFDPDMIVVFFSLRTCMECKFFGIFVFYRVLLYERIRQIPPERIDAAFDRLVESGWVRYERPILWIVKALKNEPSFSPDNPLHVKGAQNHLRTLAKLKIVREFATYYRIPYPYDTPTIPLRKGIDTPSARYPSDTPPNQGEGDYKSTSTPGAAFNAASEDQFPDDKNGDWGQDIPCLLAEVKAGVLTPKDARDNVISRGATALFANELFPDQVEEAGG